MITMFAAPKAFLGSIEIIQENALRSWKRLVLPADIILFGQEKGVNEAAKKFGTVHINSVDTNSYGTPLLNKVFAEAERLSRHEILCYANSDIIFNGDLLTSVHSIGLKRFLLIGRRREIEISGEIKLESHEDEKALLDRLNSEARIGFPTAIDYFVFPRGTFTLPPFPVGRALWDNWLVFNARFRGIPVIDGTSSIHAFHQNHDYSHLAGGLKEAYEGPEVMENWRIIGRDFYPFDVRDADHALDDGRVHRKRNIAWILRSLITMPCLHPALRPLVRAARFSYQALRHCKNAISDVASAARSCWK